MLKIRQKQLAFGQARCYIYKGTYGTVVGADTDVRSKLL